MYDRKRFEVVYKEGGAFKMQKTILVDKQTGVNYLFVANGYAGGLTVLMDANGKPVISK